MSKQPQGHQPHLDNPPWLYLLDATNLGWREDQILKGRDPDPYIGDQLRKAGAWPPNDQVAGENA